MVRLAAFLQLLNDAQTEHPDSQMDEVLRFFPFRKVFHSDSYKIGQPALVDFLYRSFPFFNTLSRLPGIALWISDTLAAATFRNRLLKNFNATDCYPEKYNETEFDCLDIALELVPDIMFRQHASKRD